MKAVIARDKETRFTLVLSELTHSELYRLCYALNSYNLEAPGRYTTEEILRAINNAENRASKGWKPIRKDD